MRRWDVEERVFGRLRRDDSMHLIQMGFAESPRETPKTGGDWK
jgi:hypothetical protein